MKNAPQLACVSMPSVLSSWLLFFSLRHRFGYSLFEEVDCHRDRGGRGFCWERVSARSLPGVSRMSTKRRRTRTRTDHEPKRNRHWLWEFGSLVDEFYPDLSRWLFHRRAKKLVSR
jgi:hypothetical protein